MGASVRMDRLAGCLDVWDSDSENWFYSITPRYHRGRHLFSHPAAQQLRWRDIQLDAR
jgi:hypothetical protein